MVQLLEEEGRKVASNKEERRRTRKLVALPTVGTGWRDCFIYIS